MTPTTRLQRQDSNDKNSNDIPTERANDMSTPGTTTQVPQSMDRPSMGELLGDLSFDELRELPMRTQMCLDLTACENDLD